ncbi:MAG: FHA domain-containing protein [Woeseia sp.]
MANDNKKINDLVSENDEDTSELEVLTATVVFDPDFDYEAESDAATHSFETSSVSAGASDESIDALKSDLRQRDESIGNLQYDIEELRARWTGLEKELKAREELTDNVTRELEQSNRKLAQTISLLRKRDTKVAALETTLGQQAARLGEADSNIEQARLDTESLQAEIAALKDRDAAAAGTIELLNGELNDEKSKRKQAEDAGHAQNDRTQHLEYQHDESRSSLATLRQYIEGRKDRWEKQEADLKARRRSLKEQRKEIVRLGREARLTAEQLRKLQAASQKANVERDNLQANLERVRTEARELRTALAEKADSRRKQQDQVAALTQQLDGAASALEQEKAHRQRVELELADGQRQLGSLRAELTALQAASAEKEVLTAELQQKIEEEALASEQEKVARRSVELELAERHQQLSSLNAELAAMEAASAEKQTLIAGLQQKIDDAAPALDREQAQRQSVELELAERQQQLSSLNADLAATAAALAEKETLIAEKQTRIDDDALALEQATAHRQSVELELAELRQRLGSLHAELRAMQAASAEKETLIADRQQQIDELSEQMESTVGRLAHVESRRRDLEEQLEHSRKQAELLCKDYDDLSAEAARNEQLASDQAWDLINLSRELKSATDRLEGEQSDHQALMLKYETLQDEATQLRAELRPLRDAVAKAEALQKAHAELSGLVSGNEDKIRDLKNQIAKTEGYADVLRMKLQQHLAESETLKSEHSEAQESLAAALARVSDLTARLDAEQRLSAELNEKNEDAEKRLAEEIRIIRFELDAAQETVAESQTLNEQLTSNLIESKSFRHALENQLTEADESRNKNIKELSKQLAQLKQQIDDYERKISNKDAAINALLTELAHKPDAPSENAADVVHRLADRKLHGADEKGSHDRDRVTRLLIGNIDGQELRFPLFKDKLTIGRTVHNDIQLKAQYVSRRHAVVATDEDCTRIVDWGSKNGIYVNGKRVTEQVLRNNDRVTVGTAEFKFEERPKR